MTNPSTGAPAAAPSFPAFLAGINPFDFIKYLPLVSRLMEVGPQIKTALASGASVDVILAKLVPDLAPLLASVGQQFFPQTTAALHPAAGLELVFDNDGTKWVQNGLNRLGLAASPAATPLRVDGDYGRNTIAAVKAYQTAHGLKPDGWAGPKTSASIALELAKLPAQ